MFEKIGKNVISKVKDAGYGLGYFFKLLKETSQFITQKHIGIKVLTMQILYTGLEALPVIAFLSLSLGAIIIIQGISFLPQLGQGDLLYSILIIVITRELGPVLTAFIIIARSATAIATEIGNMVVSHEIEAYVATGIDPISYIAVPRFLGVTLSLVILNIYFNIFGLAGSYFITQLIRPIPILEYFRNLMLQLKAVDIISSIVKSFAFGMIISAVATLNGFRVKTASYEIPQVVIKAVAQTVTFCMLADAVITAIYYM